MYIYQSAHIFVGLSLADFAAGTKHSQAVVTKVLSGLASGPGFTYEYANATISEARNALMIPAGCVHFDLVYRKALKDIRP
jgi:hypothetical protein